MKKYKLLNAKGLLFTLGTASAVIAPVATLVACGTNSPKTLDKSVIDQKVHEQKINMIHETMFKELGGWHLGEMDIFELVFNTEESGIVNVSRLASDGNPFSALGNEYIDGTFNVGGKPQHIDSDVTKTVAAFKLDITKQNIVSNKDELKNANKKLVDFIAANPGDYAAKVVATKQDSKDRSGTFTGGEYQVQLFRKTAPSPKISSLFSLLSDKNKMSVDMSLLEKAGGTYLMGQYSHSFNMGRGTGFDEFGTQVTQKGIYGDQSNEDNLKSWTSFGPTTSTSISNSDITSVAGLNVNQYLEEDKKTHVFTLVTTAKTTGANSSFATHYLPLPELNSFSNKQHDMNKIVDILTGKKNFAFYYNFLKGLDVNLLESAGTAKRHIRDIAALLPEMAKVSDLLHDNQFVSELVTFIKNEDPSFSFSTFQVALENMENNTFTSPDAFGPKTFELMHYNERFYTHAKTFLLNNPTWAAKAIQVKDADTFYNLQKEEADYKQYLVDHKTTLDALKLQSTSDKTLTKTEIEYYELNITNAKEIQDAATKLGANATKAEILAEAKKALSPFSTLQAFIDAKKALGKLIISSSVDYNDSALNGAINKSTIYYQNAFSANDKKDLQDEIRRLVTNFGQTLVNPNSGGVDTRPNFLIGKNFVTTSFNADTITLEFKIDTKSADGAIHHNSQTLTFYRHA